MSKNVCYTHLRTLVQTHSTYTEAWHDYGYLELQYCGSRDKQIQQA